MAKEGLGELVLKLSADIDELKEQLNAAEKLVEKSGRKQGSAVGKAFGKAGKIIKTGLISGAVAGAAGLAVITKSALGVTAELEQNLGGSEAVFGKYASNIQKIGADAYKNLGVSQSDYLASANVMASLFQGSGISQKKSLDLTSKAMQRAGDVASVMGISTEVAMQSIAGAAKGNFTMMDNLGVAMNATTLEAYALAEGMNFKWNTASQAQKNELAMKMFFDKTKQYAGNFAKESETTMSGSMGMVKASWENMMASLGSGKDLEKTAAQFGNALVTLAGNVLPVIKTIISNIPTMLAGLGPILASGLQSLMSSLGIDFKLPKIAMGDIVDSGLVSEVKKMVSSMAGSFSELLKSLKSSGAASALLGIMKGLGAVIKGLMPIISALGAALVGGIQMILPYIVQLFNELTPALMTVGTWLAALGGFVQQHMTVFKTVAAAAIMFFLGKLIGIIQIFTGVVGMIQGIIKGDWAKVWESFKKVLSGALMFFAGSFAKLMPKVLPLLGRLFSSIGNLAKVGLAKLGQLVVAGLGKLPGLFGRSITALPKLYIKLWSKLASLAISGLARMGSVIVSGLARMISAYAKFAARIPGFIAKAYAKMVQFVVRGWVRVVTAIAKGISKAVRKTGEFVGKIAGKLKGVPAKLEEIGGDIMAGLLRGLNAAWDGILNRIREMGDAIPGWLKKRLGIASPSKVMAEIGYWIGAGMAQGIGRSAKEVMTQANALYKAAVDTSSKAIKTYYSHMDAIDKLKASQAKERAEIARLKAARTAAQKSHGVNSEQYKKANNAVKAARARLTKSVAEGNRITAAASKIAAKNAKEIARINKLRVAGTKASNAYNNSLKRQQQLENNLAKIASQNNLASASLDLAGALGLHGGEQLANLRIEQLQNEANQLQAYLNRNAKDLTAEQQADLIGQIASAYSGINDLRQGIIDAQEEAKSKSKEAADEVYSGWVDALNNITKAYDRASVELEYSGILGGIDTMQDQIRLAQNYYDNLLAFKRDAGWRLETDEMDGLNSSILEALKSWKELQAGVADGLDAGAEVTMPGDVSSVVNQPVSISLQLRGDSSKREVDMVMDAVIKKLRQNGIGN